MPSRYWQHETPLTCPNGHVMGWLGSAFWLCMQCPRYDKHGQKAKGRGTIWVQTPEPKPAGEGATHDGR